MKINQIIQTKWARDFKKESPKSYNLAIHYAIDPKIIFNIYKTNETKESFFLIEYNDCWMGGFDTRKEAIHFCQKMDWNYKIKTKSPY